jgi:hypothetical protein
MLYERGRGKRRLGVLLRLVVESYSVLEIKIK